jgi:hypothetical protein
MGARSGLPYGRSRRSQGKQFSSSVKMNYLRRDKSLLVAKLSFLQVQ